MAAFLADDIFKCIFPNDSKFSQIGSQEFG